MIFDRKKEFKQNSLADSGDAPDETIKLDSSSDFYVNIADDPELKEDIIPEIKHDAGHAEPAESGTSSVHTAEEVAPETTVHEANESAVTETAAQAATEAADVEAPSVTAETEAESTASSAEPAPATPREKAMNTVIENAGDKAKEVPKVKRKGKKGEETGDELPDLTKLKKKDLLEIMLRQGEEIDSLRAEVADLQKKLDDKNFQISRAGSIAEASLLVTNIFEEAQKAAIIYLKNVKRMADAQASKSAGRHTGASDEE